MDLVDNIYTAAHFRWRINRVLPQSSDVIDTVIGGGVYFQNVHTAAGIDAPAGGAAVAGVAVLQILAVDGFGQNFGTGGLTGTSGAGEQVGMAEPSRNQLIFQRLGDAPLPHYIVEGLGPVFSIQCLVHPFASPKKLSHTLFSHGHGTAGKPKTQAGPRRRDKSARRAIWHHKKMWVRRNTLCISRTHSAFVGSKGRRAPPSRRQGPAL